MFETKRRWQRDSKVRTKSFGLFFVGVFVGVFVTKPFNIFFPFVFLVLSCVSFLSVQSTV